MVPKISIIIPFFNSEKTLERAIESVNYQNYLDWELIFVNDGSIDQSEKKAQSYNENPRFNYFYEKNRGVSAARNLGSSQAKGDWLIFLDADDQLRPGFLQVILEEIKLANDVDFLAFGLNRIKGEQSEITLPLDGQYFSRIPGTFVIKKSTFDQVGGYDERFKFSENTELFHRLELINAKGKNIPFVSLNYYDNPTGGSKNLQNMIDSLTLILDKHAETLSPHVKHLYHQIIGVNLMRFRNFSKARKHLWKAVQYKPQRIATWGRLGLAFFPVLAKMLYSETVNYG